MNPRELIRPVGLSDTNRKLDTLADNAERMSDDVSVTVAGMVIEKAQPKVPRVSGIAAGSLQAYVTNEGATASGGEGVEYYRWLELGGASGRGGSNVREIIPEGRYIRPAYEEMQDEIKVVMVKGLRMLAEESGFKVD